MQKGKHEMLLNVIINFVTWDDPKISPVPVRASLALLAIAISAIAECHLCFGLSFVRCLGALGIVLGVFTAGIRHWQSVASDQDLKRFGNDIFKMGNSTKLSITDIAAVIALAHLSFTMAYLISGAIVLMAKYHPDQMKLPVWLALVVVWIVYFPSAPILSYVSAKTGRCLCSRWRIRLQRDTEKTGVKGILSLISFCIAVVAGALALPNLLL
jgi:hypothetical protein